MLKIFLNYWQSFVYGAFFTLLIAIVSTIIGLILGLLLSFVRNNYVENSRNKFKFFLKKIFNFLINVYVEVFRGTPMMVQAMIIYYGVFNLGFRWSKLLASIVIVSINTGAYMTEIVRSGLQAINKGQYEAARSLGMNQFQTFLNILLPQALKNAFPAIGNEFIVNIKDTSVLNCIGVIELYFQSISIAGSTFDTVATFLITALIYLFLTFTVSRLLNFIELKLHYDKHSYPASQSVMEGVNALK